MEMDYNILRVVNTRSDTQRRRIILPKGSEIATDSVSRIKKSGNAFHRIRPNVVCKLCVSLELSKCSGENSTNSSVAAYVDCNFDVVQTLPELHITADTIFTEHILGLF